MRPVLLSWLPVRLGESAELLGSIVASLVGAHQSAVDGDLDSAADDSYSGLVVDEPDFTAVVARRGPVAARSC